MDLKLIINRYYANKFELSYETFIHKKIPPFYDTYVAIPFGSKCLLWFTFYQDKHIVVLFHLDKNKEISNTEILDIPNLEEIPKFHLGTLVLGCLVNDRSDKSVNQRFVYEDLICYQGNNVKEWPLFYKLQMFLNLADYVKTFQTTLVNLYLPVIWKRGPMLDEIGNIPQFPYNVHHYQYRSLYKHSICYSVKELRPDLPRESVKSRQEVASKPRCESRPEAPAPVQSSNSKKVAPRRFLPHAPAQTKKTFIIKADLQADIYHLFNNDKSRAYNDVAFIPNYKTSIMMNKLFRVIKENDNLDAIEESDDEDDFENCQEDKYVDLNKEIEMECYLHTKFRKWVPYMVHIPVKI